MQTNPSFSTEPVLKSLQDPARRELYAYIAGSAEPVSRDQAAQAADISRTLAAYHLDHLAAAGLLHVSYARPGGKTGPGAGRPAKLYAAAQEEISLSLPARNYRLLASLLATAAAADGTGAVATALESAAKSEGQRIGGSDGCSHGVLEELGYRPHPDAEGATSMLNCPFHAVASQQTELVCHMNQQLLEGMLEGAGDSQHYARLNPQPGRCCVQIVPRI